MSMKVYFIRHGQTNYNVLDLCNDDPTKDVHLTKFGIKQANTVAKKLRGVKFDAVFVSDLKRTRETAKIVIGNQNLKFTVDKRISDRKTGFDSKPASDFFRAMEKNILNTKINNGESLAEEKERVVSFLKDLKSLKFNKILVSTHGEVLKIVYGYYNQLPNNEMWETSIDNCQVLEFDL